MRFSPGSGDTFRTTLSQWVNWNENGDGPSYKELASVNMSFRDKTLYSYHTPIAKYYEFGPNNKFVLVSRETYSPTTQRHMKLIHRYINVLTFEVEYLGEWGGRRSEPVFSSTADMHAENAHWMWERILVNADHMGKAFKEEHQYLYFHARRQLDTLYSEWLRYRRATGQDVMMVPILQELFDQADAINAENKHKYYHPNAVARRERARARAIAKRAFLKEGA